MSSFTFTVHDLQSAPEKSRSALRTLKDTFGFVPNIAGTMAGSPALLGGFISVFQNAHAGTLGEAQIQVLLLANAVTNACRWAVAFHTHLALQQGVSVADVQAMRDGLPPRDPQHAALSGLGKSFIERRGHVEEARLQAFIDAGFTQEQALEVILVVSASTITNYTGTLTQPPLEDAFQAYAWQSASASASA
jgi:AhpD family alkylhydroperoxidase